MWRVRRTGIICEHRAAAFVLLKPSLGPSMIFTSLKFGGGDTSKATGVVFGYQGFDQYWTKILDATKIRTKVVADGVQSTLASNNNTPSSTNWNDLYPRTHRRSMEHLGGYNFTTDGLPAGRIGLYGEVAASKFNYLTVSNNAAWAPMTDAWQNYNDDALTNEQAINTNTDRLYFTRGHNPLPVLMGASGGGGRVNRFRATFALRMEQTYGATQKLFFLFNAKDAEHADGLMLFVGPSSAPQGQRWEDGKLQTSVSGTGTSANWPSFTVGDVQWVEITHDGSTLTVKAQKTATEPSDASWSSVGAAYTSTSFSTSGGGGGRIGFRGDIAYVSVDDLKLWADTDSNGSYEALVHHETFTLRYCQKLWMRS